jgi:hypothetical protein
MIESASPAVTPCTLPLLLLSFRPPPQVSTLRAMHKTAQRKFTADQLLKNIYYLRLVYAALPTSRDDLTEDLMAQLRCIALEATRQVCRDPDVGRSCLRTTSPLINIPGAGLAPDAGRKTADEVPRSNAERVPVTRIGQSNSTWRRPALGCLGKRSVSRRIRHPERRGLSPQLSGSRLEDPSDTRRPCR